MSYPSVLDTVVVYRFADALDLCKAVFYDLTAKQLMFIFRSCPEKKQLIFTSVRDANTIKHYYPKFEIKRDSRQEIYAELVINYE